MKRKYLNTLSKLFIVVTIISVTSCKQKGGQALEYMPDMFRSPSMETYVDYGELRGQRGNDSIINTMEAKQPVKGTIARGFMPYIYENSIEGYNAAGENLKSPFPYTEETVKKGKELFGMFCVHCHGKTGQGDGTLVQRDKFPPLPIKFNDTLDLPEGKMFHTITFGKNLMGAHASQLNTQERWELIHFIRSKFMNKFPSAEETKDSTATEIAQKTIIQG